MYIMYIYRDPNINLIYRIMYYLVEIISMFLVFFYFFEKKLPTVRIVCVSSVEIISFRGISLSNRPIYLKIGLNVRERAVHACPKGVIFLKFYLQVAN